MHRKDAVGTLERRQHRQCRLSSLVLVAPTDLETVATAVAHRVVQRHLGVVVAEEPLRSTHDTIEPIGMSSDGKGSVTSVGQRGDLDRLLVVAGTGFPCSPSAYRRNREPAIGRF